MNYQDFVKAVQNRLAGAIGPSTLRNQGAPGVTRAARDFLNRLDLSPLKDLEPAAYADLLQAWTEQLRLELPDGARNWGTARKALNVFMVEVFFNRFTASEYQMDRLKDVLETPLDSQAFEHLQNFARQHQLTVPPVGSIRDLLTEQSDQYQQVASQMGAEEEIPRAALDLLIWVKGEG